MGWLLAAAEWRACDSGASINVAHPVAIRSIPLFIAHGHAEYLLRNEKNSVPTLAVTRWRK